MPSGSRIFLIDAHALCYRAFYAVKDLRNSKGQPTNAVFGFLNILRKILKDHAPEYAAACFDVGKKTRRQERYSDYKIQRPAMPEDLAGQIPLIKELISAYRIPLFEKEGFEADDVIATLARRFQGSGAEVVIVTDDKDMYQLIDEGIRIYASRKDKIVGAEDARERFGIAPSQIVDYLALAGDASDNIPGVDGIGEVTARTLIQQYGSLENVLKNAELLKGKLKDKVTNGREQALLSQELATLDDHVPLECSLEDLRLQGPDHTALGGLFQELEFRNFLSEVKTAEPAIQAPQPVSVGEICRDIASLEDEIKRLKRAAFWVDPDEEGGLFPAVRVCAGEKVYEINPDEAARLQPLLGPSGAVSIVYDLKTVRKALGGGGLVLDGEVFDVLLAAYLLLAGQSSYEIEALAWHYLKRPLPEAGHAAQAVKALFDLEPLLRAELKEKGAGELYREMELPLSRVLFDMEREGVRLDTALLEKLSGVCDEKIKGMTERIFALAGGEFNINSPKQLGVVLFEKLELPAVKRTKTGYSTDEEVLTRLSSQHELPAMILEYRQMAKLKSTYIDALPRLVDPATGKVHCSFNQTGAETGRLSSNHPNLQNIPIRTEMGREIRKAFLPSEGNVLLSADYSQIELRVLAHLADEPALKEAFESGEDIHRYTAGLIFDVAPKDVTTQMRYSAKRINFGIIYGMSAFGLAKDLGVPNKEAQSFIDRYFLRYPGIRTFMDREIEKARAQGYIETLFKRRRYLPDIHSRNPAVRQFAERQAINTPVQGTAADLIKAAMVKVSGEISKAGLKTRMIITVHDELVCDVPAGELADAASLIKTAMEGAIRLSVPLEATVKAGRNWAEMETV